MIEKIKQFFETHLAPESDGMVSDPEHALKLAVTVLLFEVAESDFKQLPEEKDALLQAVSHYFTLDQGEAQELLSMAESEHADSTDYYEFTRLINRHYSPGQKSRLIEMLWQIAFADQSLHRYEEHVIRRLSELLHVPHSVFIAAKHRADNRSG
ncbi:MAG: TerB family tellurite resistance protein [Sedimenticola sp.]|nr:TerB family tellurite resistance protein [Sedimenticola sp.]